MANNALDSQAQSSYLSALRQIDNIAVPDLAATLTTQAEDDANDANISFLRTNIDPQDEWRAQNADAELEEHRQRLQAASSRMRELRGEDRERRERLQRVLSRLNRLHDPAYGDRIPTANNLYDWSPQGDHDDEEAELQDILHELRRQQPHTNPEILRVLGRSQLDAERESRNRSYQSRFDGQPSTSESSLRSQALWQSVRRHPRISARSRDYMQRYIMDRERIGTEREERDRYHWRNPPSTAAPPPPPPPPATTSQEDRYELSRMAWQAQRGSSEGQTTQRPEPPREEPRGGAGRMWRRSYLDDTSGSAPLPSPWLQQTIQYLAHLRNSTCYEDSLGYAVDSGFVTKEFFGENHDDFIFDIHSLPQPAETSMLAPGSVFSGFQLANTVIPVTNPNPIAGSTVFSGYGSRGSNRTNDPSQTSAYDPAPRPPYRSWAAHNPNPYATYNYIPPHARRTSALEERPSTPPSSNQDRWPVKVTIHAVDYESMTISATMEAYNVPSHPQPYSSNNPTSASSTASSLPGFSPISPTYTSSVSVLPPQLPPLHTLGNSPPRTQQRTSSITTYLEGEILNFSTHTLLTESFASSPANDATYWRKLEPFAKFSADELVRHLVSHRFITELRDKYILMRWKERCFVQPTTHTQEGAGSGGMEDCGCGLTISGFYYVCMRRSDGEVEGLYCDPQSSPYQHLRLKREGGGKVFTAWGFR